MAISYFEIVDEGSVTLGSGKKGRDGSRISRWKIEGQARSR
jgi:hypothetical protein